MHICQDTIRYLYEEFVLKGFPTYNSNVLIGRMQKAYWHYLDYMAPEKDKNVISLNMFVASMSRLLGWRPHRIRKNLVRFYIHNKKVPRCGGVLVNKACDQVLLVQGWSKKWSFPVGKKDAHESYRDCAIREVFEETGYKGTPSEDMLTYKYRGAVNRLFIFYNVPTDFEFAPQTRNEIFHLEWVPMAQLSKRLHLAPIEEDLHKCLQARTSPTVLPVSERDLPNLMSLPALCLENAAVPSPTTLQPTWHPQKPAPSLRADAPPFVPRYDPWLTDSPDTGDSGPTWVGQSPNYT